MAKKKKAGKTKKQKKSKEMTGIVCNTTDLLAWWIFYQLDSNTVDSPSPIREWVEDVMQDTSKHDKMIRTLAKEYKSFRKEFSTKVSDVARIEGSPEAGWTLTTDAELHIKTE